MERGTITTLDKLQEGDRFYKLADKTKKVYQVKAVIKDRWDKITSVHYEHIVKAWTPTGTATVNNKPQELSIMFLRNINSI